MTKRTIPQVRVRLAEVAEELRALSPACEQPRDILRLASEINALVVEMVREPAVRRAPTQSPYVTDKVVKAVRRLADNNPDVPMNRIAEHFGINQGRVSEILNGKR